MTTQGTHHFVIATQTPIGDGGFAIADWSGWITPDPAWTRSDTYRWIKEEHARLNGGGGAVLFFALEPNQL